jgi:hypothetical protein
MESLTFSGLDFAGAPAGITGISVTSVWNNAMPFTVSHDVHSVTIQFDTTNQVFGAIGNYIDIQLEVAQPVVPEPATLGLIGMGLAGIAAARKRRRQRA